MINEVTTLFMVSCIGEVGGKVRYFRSKSQAEVMADEYSQHDDDGAEYDVTEIEVTEAQIKRFIKTGAL